MSSRPFAEGGVTLVEMIVTIVLFSVVAAVGGLLIGKLAPSYLISVQAEQVLSPREAALWRLSEDFRKSLVEGTSQSNFVSGCTVYLNVASGVTVDVAGDSVTVSQIQVQYSWESAVHQLTVSAPWVSGIMLDNVTAGSCPFTYLSGVGRSRLNVAFSYQAGVNEPVTTHVSTTLYSHAAGPYLLSLNPACGLAGGGETVTINGTGFTGTSAAGVALGGSAVTPTSVSDKSIVVTAPGPHATGFYSVSMTTPEGYSMLRNGYRYIVLSPSNGTTGTTVTITGGGFTNATGVTISGVSASNFVSTVNVITISAPDVGGQTGLAPVIINGISPACTLPGAFTYN